MTTAPASPASAPMEFTVTRNEQPMSKAERAKALENPGFGNYFTDHMVSIEWTVEDGWHDAQVMPYQPLQMDPASAVLHYSQTIFEGLRVFRHADGSIHAFRPDQNAARMRRSAERLALPELPDEVFLEAVDQLVRADADWVPSYESGHSLYVRPFMMAFENFLGVRAAHRVRFMVIACPAGAYFKDPTRPVSIWLDTEHARAGSGGTGSAKCGGNYAASLLSTNIAYANGCEQVLFLDSIEHRYLEELGGMNIALIRRDGTLTTPQSETILPGVTRDSLLEIASGWGVPVERRQIPLEEWRDGVDSGEIVEAFACGTAAVVAPIGDLKSTDFELHNPALTADSLALRLRSELVGIQRGEVADERGWLRRIV